MAREQVFVNAQYTVTASGVALPAAGTNQKVTSIIFQCPTTNVASIFIGDSAAQYFELRPGDTFSPTGDALDVGTGAYYDPSKIYYRGQNTSDLLTVAQNILT